MTHIARTIFVPYTPMQMFDLVADIDQYASFLPYCLESHVIREQGELVEGAIRVGYKNMGYSFTSRNHNQPPNRIHMALLKGPFSRLEGEWTFNPTPSGCSVEIQLTVEMKFSLLASAFKHKINEAADLMMNAFIDRARTLYG